LVIEKRLTDADAEKMAKEAAQSGDVELEGEFLSFVAPSAYEPSSSWPFFRGPEFNNVVTDSPDLREKWVEEGPPVLWSVELGEGHAGASVFQGLVYMLDYDEEKQGDALRCFSLESGQEIWRRWYKAPTKRNHGRSRTVPAVTEKSIVTMGPRGFVLCVETTSGDFKWGIDLVKTYGTEIPHWYTAQCPIIERGQAVIAPAGTVLMMGVDCETGSVQWTTPNDLGWRMSHTSILPMEIQGKMTYVYSAIGGVAGVSAEEEDLGELLWSFDGWKPSVAAPSPVQIPDDRIFLTAGYGSGSMMIQVKKASEWSVETLYSLDKSVFSCEQQTPIFWNNMLFSVLPKDAGALKAQFVCLNLDGEPVWNSGKEHRFGLGPFLLAGDRFFILDDNGMLTMLRASQTGYKRLAQYRVLKGRDAWAPMAFVDGKLLLRDSTRLICLDLRQEPI